MLTPTPENSPAANETQTETQRQQQQIRDLQKDIRTGEKWLIWLTGAMALFALCGVLVGILQWQTYSGQLNVMRRTLAAMKQSGQDATNQTNQLIGNTNWLARETMYAVGQG